MTARSAAGVAAAAPEAAHRPDGDGTAQHRPLRLYLANLLSALTPRTRLFRLRAAAFRRAGVRVDRSARVNGGVRIGHPGVHIGAGTWIGARTELVATQGAGIAIGARCDVSQDVLFVCGTHDIGGAERRAGAGRGASISVGPGTWVGARATFTAGSSVGSGCVVGAGALVRGTFGDDVLVAGVPARVVRRLTADRDR